MVIPNVHHHVFFTFGKFTFLLPWKEKPYLLKMYVNIAKYTYLISPTARTELQIMQYRPVCINCATVVAAGYSNPQKGRP